ncbi:MAG: hypothetical protein Kow0068_06600 [Marinilabiliales bacterium]
MKKSTILIILFCILSLLQSCTIRYSFNSGALSPDIKTFSVKDFQNRATIVNPSLSLDLTEGLKDKFLSQTRLELVEDNGDLMFEGDITGYNSSPVNIQGNETAAQNRLTITVKVKFTNNIDPDQNFEQTFSAYEDYSNSQSLDQVESSLVPDILEKLTDDIFNKSVANW